MRENELLIEITRTIDGSSTLEEAIQHVQSVLNEEIGAACLIVCPEPLRASHFREGRVLSLLDSREFPFRGVYSQPIRNGDRCLIACFGSWGAAGDLLQRIVAHIATAFDRLLAQKRTVGQACEEAA